MACLLFGFIRLFLKEIGNKLDGGLQKSKNFCTVFVCEKACNYQNNEKDDPTDSRTGTTLFYSVCFAAHLDATILNRRTAAARNAHQLLSRRIKRIAKHRSAIGNTEVILACFGCAEGVYSRYVDKSHSSTANRAATITHYFLATHSHSSSKTT